MGEERKRISSDMERPHAAFADGRWHLLRGESDQALGAYARGVQHALTCATCVPADLFTTEEKRLITLTKSKPLVGGYRWAIDLLQLADGLRIAGTEPAHHTGQMKTPVLIVAGGVTSLQAGQLDLLRPMLAGALAGFHGTVISGGTAVGIPGLVGEIAGALAARGAKLFDLVGYIPQLLPNAAPRDVRYDRFVTCGEDGFSPDQIIRYWQDILACGIRPADVALLGVGGGSLCSVEYRLALALGANVAMVKESGGAADALIADPEWTGVPHLLVMPFDESSLRAFIIPPPKSSPSSSPKRGRRW